MSGLSGGAIATTVLIVGAGAGTFASFCPSWFTVRSPFFHDQAAKPGNIAAIRQGEAAGTLVTMVEGVAATWMTGSLFPLIGAVLISALMVAGYEYSIAHPATEHVLESPGSPPKLAAFRYGAA
jgi:hypothetical protein